MSVRTRFAPSPTGFLHVGGARTALYAWLYAKRHHGTFILRIEDTDRERSTPEAVQAILDGMAWLGLTPDEGPYYQTQRFAHYQAVAEQLLQAGKAYRCYCSKERLTALREEQMAAKIKPRYDGHCRQHTSPAEGQPYVIRFANPLSGSVTFQDAVHGAMVFQNQELDDLIIVRSDGTPTYNFTVVVDDWEMRITHVIRGDDHLNNTPRQINILQALGAPIPQYAHLPMILGADGKKLSKRHGAVSVMQYRDEGFLPAALLNYLVRLGWSHGDQEIFSLAEMQALFDIADLNKAAAAFNPGKLLWLNQHYLKTLPLAVIEEELRWHLARLGVDIQAAPALAEVIAIQRERCKTVKEMAERSRFFYEEVWPTVSVCEGVQQFEEEPLEEIHISANFEALQEKYLSENIQPALQALYSGLSTLNDWTAAAIHAQLQQILESFQLKMGDLAQPVRVLLSGGTVSPPLDATMAVLGKTQTLARLARFCIDNTP